MSLFFKFRSVSTYTTLATLTLPYTYHRALQTSNKPFALSLMYLHSGGRAAAPAAAAPAAAVVTLLINTPYCTYLG